MDKLKRDRKFLRSQATRLRNDIDEKLEAAGTTAQEIAILREKLQDISRDLKAVDSELKDKFSDEEYEREMTATTEYRHQILETITRIDLRSQVVSTGASTSAALNPSPVPAASVHRDNKIKLPKLELPKFHGAIDAWLPFWTRYEVAVHHNNALTATEKFCYLTSLLTGNAADLIRGLNLNEGCYNEAIELLKKEYGSSTRIADEHIRKLTNMVPVTDPADISKLRQFYNEIQSRARSLQVLGISTDAYSALLRPIILSKLPQDMVIEHQERQEFNDSTRGADVASGSAVHLYSQDFQDLMDYLRVKIVSKERALGYTGEEKHEGKPNIRKVKTTDMPTASALLNANNARTPNNANHESCLFCKSDQHRTVTCDSDIPLQEKKRLLIEARCCLKCTRRNHIASRCQSYIRCRKCSRRHATSLCDPDYIRNRSTQQVQVNTVPVDPPGEVVLAASAVPSKQSSTIILGTTMACAKGPENTCWVRVLFDSGSQRSFITEELAKQLGCHSHGVEKISIGSFGGATVTKALSKTSVKLQTTQGTAVEIDVLQTQQICANVLPAIGQEHLKGTFLLEGTSNVTTADQELPISILIGTDWYWRLVQDDIRRINDDLVCVPTELGWFVHGVVNDTMNSQAQEQAVMLCVRQGLQRQFINNIWGPEDEADYDDKTAGEVLNRFNSTVRNVNGRYEVRLPWKDDIDLGTNERNARKRLKGLTDRLLRTPDLLKTYDDAIRKYLIDGVAEKVPENEYNHDQVDRPVYYLPHHAVIRTDRITTKCRIVFDASAHETQEISLNENLHIGPNMNPNVSVLLLRFRLHAVAFTADIEKAFLQILIHKRDRDALRFLWYQAMPTGVGDKLEIWRMTRVTFGTGPSTFLLAATLKKLLRESEVEYPETTRLLNDCTYVDDFISGADCEEAAINVYNEVKNIMQKGSMNMRKWASNSARLNALYLQDPEEVSPFAGDSRVIKVLGMKWDTEQDSLFYNATNLLQGGKPAVWTKRKVLQTAQSIYDPLGLMSPYTIAARIYMQKMWQQSLTWDQPIPADLQESWERWYEDLQYLTEIKINRYYGMWTTNVSLHVFCDASCNAYGAVAYLVIKTSDSASSNIVLAKARVAPVKKQTLPRLELQAAVVAVKISRMLMDAFPGIKQVFFWTDSTIVLYWLHGKSENWKEYVRRRVNEVKKYTKPTQWRHCPGTENVADMVTRGLRLTTLTTNDKWWNGPNWLTDEQAWPEECFEAPSCREEAKHEQTALATTTAPAEEVTRCTNFSSLNRLHRVTAWIKRFCGNCKGASIDGPLSMEEIENAKNYWLRHVQVTAFPEEYQTLKAAKSLKRRHFMQKYRPFLDENGIMRVEGRLQMANLTFDEKHPIIMPRDAHYVSLLVEQAHRRVMHGGVADTLA
ncbi:uncharacterized protein LOC135389144 [Ornithodoros turicata]|uniref:uncharacterized protein LOC135389144 n=1 Tax=Ornithodoros turicata TaxID=34597 RepID=UPI003139E71B